MDSTFNPEANVEVHHIMHHNKTRSLGNELNMEGTASEGIGIDYEINQRFSCVDSHPESYSRMFDDPEHGGLVDPFESKDSGMKLLNQYPESLVSGSFQVNLDPVCTETSFSIGDPDYSEGEVHEDFATQLSGEHVNDSGHDMSGTRSMIGKSCSLPNMEAYIPTSGEASPSHSFLDPCCRSFEKVGPLDVMKKEFLNHAIEAHVVADQERDSDICESEKDKYENPFTDGYDSDSLTGLTNNWTISGMHGVDMVKNLQEEPSAHWSDELPSNEFKIKRIYEWVSTIDLQDISPLQEINEPSYPTAKLKKVYSVLGGMTTAKLDADITPGMEAAKNYISSLTAVSTSAQLTNFGLIAIPFLSAFVNLRLLNLSGNAIVRITAGALPRGLHLLNLSKNNISIVEGLRELTRLRILDLSCNRIFRIGHGLAYCSSLKELHLAGNKISEVEGLHRLLKLNILDLRFNKISTAKCLSQLAANYGSLQAISLQGNPAQRNMGDEQLKKYLQGLLPNLIYYNRHPNKASSFKEVTDRLNRSTITSHQFDHGLRSEHKLTRRGSHSVTTQKSSSSIHGRTSQAVSSTKRSKGRHSHLPPIGTTHHHHYMDLDSKLLPLRSNHSMRRIRSERTMRAC